MAVHAGDWVEVLSKEEILRTLDQNGRLDELPFMPQMFKYCGQRFRIYKTASKTCDTVSGHYVGRRLQDGYHLNLRCDGLAYGGCQAGCLIFWKGAWLKRVDGPTQIQYVPERVPVQGGTTTASARCTESDVEAATRRQDAGGDVRYHCQATELLKYTKPLAWWDVSQYIDSYRSGNRTLAEIARGLLFLLYYYGALAFSDRWGRPARWLYNRIQAIAGGVPFPRLKGKIPRGQPTPRCDLDLRPGDLVRVKSYEEILATLDVGLSNRGLSFDAELVPFCGKTFHVSTRVERFVNEKTGKMQRMNTPAVILEGVTCKALYCGQRMFCPRSINLWWREIWLERASTPHRAAPAIQAAPRTTAKLAG
ncbi:hypothetical protein [Bradyrhizobium ivorense]|uniref:hypothetical protein n=1 Tax=Bradyrhizobium ivorense TaxID=2511166 RepID=UPI0010BB1AC3|nr:hypothetical protein [Bradyrhizobium ivorense]VIO72031.1 hypothetical protein CI41S_33980 [Bradyrhizobium ivorense]